MTMGRKGELKLNISEFRCPNVGFIKGEKKIPKKPFMIASIRRTGKKAVFDQLEEKSYIQPKKQVEDISRSSCSSINTVNLSERLLSNCPEDLPVKKSSFFRLKIKKGS
jgi:hypothetical protein